MAAPLANEYWLLRHGRSLANEAAIIVSSVENGIREEWALAPAGVEQAETSGRAFGEAVRLRPGAAVAAYASPFSRTLQTAAVALQAAGLGDTPVQVAPDLRERFFGAGLELQPYAAAYGTIWERDVQDSGFQPGGDGESVAEVAARVRGLFKRLEADHPGGGTIVLLVSHGDTLSITQAAMTDGDVQHHRRFAFETAELRRLPAPPTHAQDSL